MSKAKPGLGSGAEKNKAQGNYDKLTQLGHKAPYKAARGMPLSFCWVPVSLVLKSVSALQRLVEEIQLLRKLSNSNEWIRRSNQQGLLNKIAH